MKRLGVLLFCVCLLSGCSREAGEIERGMQLRTKLLQAESCHFDVDITADYGEEIYTFSMKCQVDNQGNVDFAVTEPESIRGISGSVREDEGILTFDDVIVQFEKMAEEQITPVCAPWVLMKTLRSGYLTSAGTEDGFIRLSMNDSYEEEALNLDIWLNEQDLPERAEILYDGKRILSLNVRSFEIL